MYKQDFGMLLSLNFSISRSISDGFTGKVDGADLPLTVALFGKDVKKSVPESEIIPNTKRRSIESSDRVLSTIRDIYKSPLFLRWPHLRTT